MKIRLQSRQRLQRPCRTCRGLVASRSNPSTLHSKRLIHDGATSGNELEIGDIPATWRLASGGGHRSQCCRRRLFQKGAHALGLTEKSFHGVTFEMQSPLEMRNEIPFF